MYSLRARVSLNHPMLRPDKASSETLCLVTHMGVCVCARPLQHARVSHTHKRKYGGIIQQAHLIDGALLVILNKCGITDFPAGAILTETGGVHTPGESHGNSHVIHDPVTAGTR